MLNKFYIKIVSLFALITASGTTFASIFSVTPTDKSKEYLGMIFGGSIGPMNLGGNTNFTIFSILMEKFNLVILVFGVISLCYITIVSTVNTAREGEALGKKFTIFTLLRPVIGILLMVPNHGSGYSALQISVMWIILNGIGLADSAWNIILQQLSYKVNISANIDYNEDGTKITPYHLKDLTKNVMIASACKNVLNQEMPELSNTSGLFQHYGPIKIYVIPQKIQGNSALDARITQTAEIKIGLESAQSPYDYICGKFLIGVELKKEDKEKLDFTEENLSNRLFIKTRALTSMFNAVDTATSLISKAHIDLNHLDEGYVTSAGEAYINQITTLVKENSSKKSRVDLTLEQQRLRSYGWIHAGSYYHVIATTQKTYLDPELSVGKMVAIQHTVIPTEIYTLLTNERSFNQHQKLNQAIDKITRFWEKDRPVSPQFNVDTVKKPSYSISVENAKTTNTHVNHFINQMVEEIKSPFERYLESIDNGDPLLALSRFGTALALDSETAVLVTDIVNLLKTEPHNFQTGPFLQQTPAVGGGLTGIRYLIIIIGATLGIYIPLIPYLVFLVSAFGWLIMVVESVFLCPMLALALCYPTEEILSKLTHGLFIVMNVFLRPILMIFGLVVGITLMRTGLSMLNFGFISALNAGTTSTVFSILSVLVIYVFVAMAIVNKAFSLIYLLANQIMRWIGGQVEHTDTESIVREVKSGFDSTVGRDQALMGRGPLGGAAVVGRPPRPDF